MVLQIKKIIKSWLDFIKWFKVLQSRERYFFIICKLHWLVDVGIANFGMAAFFDKSNSC
jgi:hypothetical protein